MGVALGGEWRKAQMAADSAWALGKHDLDCALARVKSYLVEVAAGEVIYNRTESHFDPQYGPAGAVAGPRPDDSYVKAQIRRMQAQYGSRMTYSMEESGGAIILRYIVADRTPNPIYLDRAAHALELYYDFSRSSPEGEPKVLPRGGRWNDWHNSDWYQLGIDDLGEASRVLRKDFYFLPESQARQQINLPTCVPGRVWSRD